MLRLRDLNLDQHLRDPALKPQFVTPMFDLVAPRYDEFTRRFSFGMDAAWKRELIRLAVTHAPAASNVIDLACGTGDLAFGVARAMSIGGTRITGIDASVEMLKRARKRARKRACERECERARAAVEPASRAPCVSFELADLGHLPMRDGGADLVTAGYAFRNAAALAPALAEAARVTRPGGTIAVLDFYRPADAVWRALFLAYLRVAGNLFGWAWHREPVAYGYIAHSIEAYVSAPEFVAALRTAGFDLVAEQRYLRGGVAIHIARRRIHPRPQNHERHTPAP